MTLLWVGSTRVTEDALGGVPARGVCLDRAPPLPPPPGAGGPKLNTRQLSKELGKGQIRPAYLLAGSEPLLRDEALEAIRKAVLGGAADEFNVDRISGERLAASVLQDSVRALPVMAAYRLVEVADFNPKGKEEQREELVRALMEAVDFVKEQRETVLVVTTPKADKRLRWVKAFDDKAAQVMCEPPTKAAGLEAFVEAEAEGLGIELGRGAARQLAERIGPHLLVLRGELVKASLLAGEGKAVTRDHVLESTGDVAERAGWDLTDAIGSGRTAAAIALLARMLASGAAPEMILGLLAQHFRKLARVRAGGDIAGAPFAVGKIRDQSKRYSVRSLRLCLDRIHATDAALKGVGALSRQAAIESLVIELSD